MKNICRKCPSSLFSLKKLLCLYVIGFCNQGASFLIFIVDELKNFTANIFFKLLVLVMS